MIFGDKIKDLKMTRKNKKPTKKELQELIINELNIKYPNDHWDIERLEKTGLKIYSPKESHWRK
jgi:hypothetical protein